MVKIIGASLTHNDDSKGYLQEWLNKNIQYLDEWIILDDKSTDDTYKILKDFALEKYNNIKCYQTDKPVFVENEIKLRTILWEKVRRVAKPGDWIINLDSDEILTSDFKNIKKFMNKEANLVFKKIEMWDEKNYRIDGLWSNYFERMYKFYDLPFGYESYKTFHAPCIPQHVYHGTPRVNTNIRIKHLAYQKEEWRIAKKEFMLNNPQQKKDDLNYVHLETITDKPVLKKFIDGYEPFEDTLLIFLSDKLYRMPREIKELIQNSDFDCMFFNSDCHINYSKDIKDIDNGFNVISKKFIFPCDNSQLLNYDTMISSVFRDYVPILNNYKHIFFIKGFERMSVETIARCKRTDKHFVLENFGNIIYLSELGYRQLPVTNMKSPIINNMVNLLSKKFIQWTNVNTFPIPLPATFNKCMIGKEKNMEKSE